MSRAGIRRLLKAGGDAAHELNDEVRVSKKATECAVKALENFYAELGNDCAAALELSRTKTVTDKLLRNSINHAMCGAKISPKELVSVRKDNERTDISRDGAVSMFSAALFSHNESYRVSKEAKEMLRLAGEAFILELGHRSTYIAKAGGRHTFKCSDIGAALRTMLP